MATLLDPPAVVTAAGHFHLDALKLADEACVEAIKRAGLKPGQIDLLLNAGIYHERNLGEPALAALIQEDVGISPEDPHDGGHGAFSFDVANGACGLLSALQVVDGFLRSGAIEHGLVVASDANPRHRMAPDFPFTAQSAAVACHFEEGSPGLEGFAWKTGCDGEDLSCSRISFEGSHNRLHVEQDPDFGALAAIPAGEAVGALLAEHGLAPADVDLVLATPLTPSFREGLARQAGIDADRILAVEGAEHVHTAALLVAFASAFERGILADAHRVLLVSAGAGIVAGAALLLR